MTSKKTPKPSSRAGIYAIVNLVNGKQYIGSATQFAQRWWLHRNLLGKKAHHSLVLQRAWDKYGETSFEFRIIEFVDERKMLLAREQYYLDTDQPEYNRSLTAGSRLGMYNSEEHRAKISAALNTPASQAKLSARWKGKKQSEEHRAARAEGMRGNMNGKGKIITPEQRTALVQGLRAAHADGRIQRSLSPKQIEKLAQARQQAAQTPEGAARRREIAIAASAAAKTKLEAARAANPEAFQPKREYTKQGTPEYKEKMRLATLAVAEKRKADPVAAAAHAESRRLAGLKSSATKQAQKAAGTAKERTPEMRERARQAQLEYNAKKRSVTQPALFEQQEA